MSSDAFSAVVGQPEAVASLRAATTQPVHAYLFVGPAGSGKLSAAAAFAAEVLAASADDAASADRTRELARGWKHPDVVRFQPEGRTLRVKEAEQLVIEASRSPVEGRRKIIVCERFHTAEAGASAALLKTIEEPAETSMFVLLAEEVKPEHVTVASRCTIIQFGAVDEDKIAEALTAAGIAAGTAAVAAAAAQGDLSRAQLLANDPEVSARHQLWLDAPGRLDGTGAMVGAVVDEITGAIDRAQGPLDARHSQETEDLQQTAEHFGVTAGARAEVTARHKRETRKLRDDELRFGFAVLARHYRGELDSDASAHALDAIEHLRVATEALTRNANETLQLQNLFAHLSPSR